MTFGPLDRRTTRLLWIGQVPLLFHIDRPEHPKLHLTPAGGYLSLATVLLVGFVPAGLLVGSSGSGHPVCSFSTPLRGSASWCSASGNGRSAGGFILAPVFSLLFRDRSHLFASITSLVVLVGFSLDMARTRQVSTSAIIMAVNVITVFVITAFILYLIARDVLHSSVEEAKRMQTILARTTSVEARDQYTYGHSDRVAEVAKLLAEHHPHGDPEIAYQSGLIHDVGKLGIPGAILLKPGRLTGEEFAVIRPHPLYGAEICTSRGVSRELIAGVLHHHDPWDGRGYPNGLHGDSIPLVGRLIGVADALDAMASQRAYRAAMDVSQVHEELVAGSGTQFDPQVVSVALKLWERIAEVLRSARGLSQRPPGQTEVVNSQGAQPGHRVGGRGRNRVHDPVAGSFVRGVCWRATPGCRAGEFPPQPEMQC